MPSQRIVSEMVKMYDSGNYTYSAIADKFNYSTGYVSRLIRKAHKTPKYATITCVFNSEEILASLDNYIESNNKQIAELKKANNQIMCMRDFIIKQLNGD